MPTLFTAGYQGLTPEQFDDMLTRAGVSTLADVRAKPLSRKAGFSKNKLAERLEGAGIGYVWLKGLGNSEAGRAAGEAKDWSGMRQFYCEHLDAPEAAEDYATLRGLALDEDVCLMCFEADPHECHRLTLAEKLSGETGLKVVHLRG